MSGIRRGQAPHTASTTTSAQGDQMGTQDNRDPAELTVVASDGARRLAGMNLSRRRLLGLAGGAVAAGAAAWAGPVLRAEDVAVASAGAPPNIYLAGTDGWIHLPPDPPIAPFHPDPLAPTGLTTYIFGFRNVTGMTTTQRLNQKYKAQHNAPLFWVNQYDGDPANEFRVQLTNLGLELRPDLFDAHTLHWHGFRNVIPFFDGEPTGSVSVPAGREFTYVYRPRDPGTYMYHCHVEDVEHVHMGMTGLVFVRPSQDGNTSLYPSGRYIYNDGDGSTGFDREFAMFLSEVWAEAHWADAHIQLPEWSDYKADFALLNGRVYPDTIAPNGSVDFVNNEFDANGDPIPPRRARRAAVPAALVARQLQRRRAGGPALLQPRLPRVGDDHRRHPDAGRRPGRDADARSQWHRRTQRRRHVLRDEHDQHRAGRELRRHLHCPRQGRRQGRTTRTTSTTGRSPDRTTSRPPTAWGARRPRSACTPPAWRRRPTRTTGGSEP